MIVKREDGSEIDIVVTLANHAWDIEVFKRVYRGRTWRNVIPKEVHSHEGKRKCVSNHVSEDEIEDAISEILLAIKLMPRVYRGWRKTKE